MYMNITTDMLIRIRNYIPIIQVLIYHSEGAESYHFVRADLQQNIYVYLHLRGVVKVKEGKLVPVPNYVPRHEDVLGEWRYSSTRS
jgi:hypothetical protein